MRISAALGVLLLSLFNTSCSLPSVPPPEMPVELERPGVLQGDRLLKKTILIEEATVGLVTDIRYGEFDSLPGAELAIVGRSAAVFLGETGRPKQTIRFGMRNTDQVVLVDVERDGVPEFLNRGSWASKVVLFEHDGTVRWTYFSIWGVDDAAAGDVDGDGRLEFVAGLNAWGGVNLLSADGKEVWHQSDGNVWHVEIVDVDGDGRGEILHSNAGGELKVLDSEGTTVSTYKGESYISDFTLTQWGDDRIPRHVVAPGDGFIEILHPGGGTVATFTAPGVAEIGGVTRATRVRFAGGGVYHATLVSYPRWGRSILYLHDEEREIAYQEVFGEACQALASVPGRNGESLLVGCVGKVWEYSPAGRKRPG